MQTSLTGQYNEKWFISVVCVSKPLIPAIPAIRLGHSKTIILCFSFSFKFNHQQQCLFMLYKQTWTFLIVVVTRSRSDNVLLANSPAFYKYLSVTERQKDWKQSSRRGWNRGNVRVQIDNLVKYLIGSNKLNSVVKVQYLSSTKNPNWTFCDYPRIRYEARSAKSMFDFLLEFELPVTW